MDDMDSLTDYIADEIEGLVREALSNALPCDLGDACIELAISAADAVIHRLTAASN